MAGNVFISYSRRDSAYIARLVAQLRSQNIPAWADGAINYGDHWEDVICAEIDTCVAFVPVMTPDAWASPWVRNEIARARDRNKPILPLLLAGDIFFGLSHVEAEDVRQGQLPRAAFTDRLRGLLATNGLAVPPVPTVVRSGRPRWLWPVAAAVAVLLVAGLVIGLTIARGSTGQTPAANGPSTSPGTTPIGNLPDLQTGPPVVEHVSAPQAIATLSLSTVASPDNAEETFRFAVDKPTGAIYATYEDTSGDLTKPVLVMAVTGTPLSEEGFVNTYLKTATDPASVHDVDPGRLTGIARCGSKTQDGKVTYVICVWADPDSVGAVYYVSRPMTDAVALFPKIRDAVLSRD